MRVEKSPLVHTQKAGTGGRGLKRANVYLMAKALKVAPRGFYGTQFGGTVIK